jgi:hypothetical protein
VKHGITEKKVWVLETLLKFREGGMNMILARIVNDDDLHQHSLMHGS